MTAPATKDVLFGGRAGATGTLQLAPRLALLASVTVGGPLARTSGFAANQVTAVGGVIDIERTFHRWDLYANVSLNDFGQLSGLYWSAGFVHRWGG
jgi:hypothetical protein